MIEQPLTANMDNSTTRGFNIESVGVFLILIALDASWR